MKFSRTFFYGIYFHLIATFSKIKILHMDGKFMNALAYVSLLISFFLILMIMDEVFGVKYEPNQHHEQSIVENAVENSTSIPESIEAIPESTGATDTINAVYKTKEEAQEVPEGSESH